MSPFLWLAACLLCGLGGYGLGFAVALKAMEAKP
jgi:hypothetical protein